MFIGFVNLDLSLIVNERRDKKGKVPTQEIEIELDKCDYPNTSMKVVISARKNFKFSKNTGIEQIKESFNPKPESQDGNFQVLSDEMIDNYQEKYMEDDQDDEFFRGYSPAKEFDQVRGTVKTDKQTQDMRNRLILEDFEPGIVKPKHTNDLPKHEHFAGIHTPPRGDEDTIYMTQTRDYSRGVKIGSGTKLDFENIKMVDLDNIDESNIFKKNEHPEDRESTIKNLLKMYEEELSSHLVTKQVNSSKDMSRENSLINTDKKRLTDLYQKAKKDLENAQKRCSELQFNNDKITFELKSAKNQFSLDLKRRDSEISDLKTQNKSLSDEISELINYKSKFDQMKSENQKLIEAEDIYENQIEELQDKLEEMLQNNRPSENGAQEKLEIYSKKIRNLEDKLQLKEQELRDERVDTDQRLNKELKVIKEGYNRNLTKLQKLKEELEDELYEAQKRCESQVDSLNEYEEKLKNNSIRIKTLTRKLREKDTIIEENKKSLEYYTQQYVKQSEERGNEESKTDFDGSKNQLINITDLEMKIIESQHKFERLEFYEKNNIKLLEEIDLKETIINDQHLKTQSEIEKVKSTHKSEILKLKESFETEFQKEKARHKKMLDNALTEEKINNDNTRKELREDFQKMFKERLSEWKNKELDYENRIKNLENIINNP